MVQRIRCAIAALILTVIGVTSVCAQSKTGTIEKDVIIILPTNIKIPPGSYNAVVQILGKNITAKVKIPASPTPPVQRKTKSEDKNKRGDTELPPPITDDSSRDIHNNGLSSQDTSRPAWYGIVLAATIPIILITLGAWLYFKIIRPRKQIQPYRQALVLLHEKNYEEALPLLTQVESKLPDGLRREARFFIAFTYLQLKNRQEAEHILTALHHEDHRNPNTTYLLAYLLVERKRYDDAESVLEGMESNDQLELHHAKKLLGIVKFHRALAALKDGRVDAAGELFEKVQTLGDFASQIPEDLRNRHIVLGTTALFEKNLPEARKQFKGLQSAAAKSPQEQHDSLLATAKLGLALLEWLEDAPDGYSTIENLLLETAKLLKPQGAVEMAWPEGAEKNVVEKLEELDTEGDLAEEKRATNHLLRDIHFLRGMAVVRAWRKMDGENAQRDIQTQYESSLARFACVRSYDEEFSDVYLVVGLLMYYFHKPGQERSRGVDLLQQAQKRGMREPDAMEIINNRERIERANADAVDKYLQILDKYLNNDTVRREVRQALMERLGKYRRIQGWEKRPDLTKARSMEPTIAEMRNRSEVLLNHIEQIIASRSSPEDVTRVRGLSKALIQDSQQLYEQAKTMEKKESELLIETGNQLFQD
ncbi:MAG: tetratricopeptide repeat protein [Planctomycetes bacterium]|nr:tetratricopeptide repeat protein [Planctomycetota bacterium]